MSEAYRLKKMIGAQLLCREGQGQGPHKSGSMLPQYFSLLQCQHQDTLDIQLPCILVLEENRVIL